MTSAEDISAAGQPERPDDQEVVQGEVQRIKEFAKTLAVDDLKEGTWFARLLTYSLDRYAEKVGRIDYFTGDPHLPPDAIVDARIQMAARYASIEGGLKCKRLLGCRRRHHWKRRWRFAGYRAGCM